MVVIVLLHILCRYKTTGYDCQISGETNLVVGDDLLVRCSLKLPSDDHVEVVEWKSDDTVIAIKQRNITAVAQPQTYKYVISGTMTDIALIRNNVQASDFRNITCTFRTSKEEISRNVSLNILHRDYDSGSVTKKPHFGVIKSWEKDRITLPLPMGTLINENVSMVEWFFIGQQSEEVYRIGLYDIDKKEIRMMPFYEARFYIDYDHKSLIIRHTRWKDTGSYICAVNKNYKERFQFDLIVNRIPESFSEIKISKKVYEQPMDGNVIMLTAIIFGLLAIILYCVIIISLKEHYSGGGQYK